ncbi:hypothetical protein QFC21_007183 [Naganishia friedmannii]|uniref:Uncharacterized protein n=1 Tax=Naganishia friedmannii TaxID=89922 RepID=A0ACC2UXI9_9TREE|nr:hypothetical protein QFC21_007183 [Naganishia friedmannii]
MGVRRRLSPKGVRWRGSPKGARTVSIVERLLTFRWPNDEGDNEEVHVAVVPSWSVEECIVSPKLREGPQVLKREDGELLQVVDVHFLGGCAGSVIIKDSSGAKKEVIFEKTIGTNVPEV